MAREAILECLSKWSDVKPTSKYIDFAAIFCKEDWWKCIEEKERDDIFQDFIEDYIKKQKEQKRKKRKELCDLLKKKLSEESNVLTLNAWKEVKEKYEKDPAFGLLDKVDFFNVWEEYALETEKDDKNEVRRSTYRIGRLRRDAFKALLEELIIQEKFHAKTDWISLIKMINNEPRYVELVGQPGSTPREIFEDRKELLQEEYYKQALIFKNCLKQAGLLVTSATTFPWIYESLRPQEEMNKVSVINCKLAFYSLLNRVAEKERIVCREYSKNVKKAAVMLSSIPTISESMSNDTIIQELKNVGKLGTFYELCETVDKQRMALEKYKNLCTRNGGLAQLQLNNNINNKYFLNEDSDTFDNSHNNNNTHNNNNNNKKRKRDASSSSHHKKNKKKDNKKKKYKSSSDSDDSRNYKHSKKHSKHRK